MTQVELWFKGDMEPTIIEGDLLKLVNDLNVAMANGKQFTLLDSPDGDVMVQTRNINKARERESAYIGR